MKRRDFAKKLLIGGIGLTAVNGMALANDADTQPTDGNISLNSEISNNHGHYVKLSAHDALKMLRESLNTGPVELNIQGSSRHPHTLVLSTQILLDLFLKSDVAIVTSEDAFHTHEVSISLSES